MTASEQRSCKEAAYAGDGHVLRVESRVPVSSSLSIRATRTFRWCRVSGLQLINSAYGLAVLIFYHLPHTPACFKPANPPYTALLWAAPGPVYWLLRGARQPIVTTPAPSPLPLLHRHRPYPHPNRQETPTGNTASTAFPSTKTTVPTSVSNSCSSALLLCPCLC